MAKRKAPRPLPLPPDSQAYLDSLAAQLTAAGFTNAEGGNDLDAENREYVFVRGRLGRHMMESSFTVKIGLGLALQSLSATVQGQIARMRHG